MVKAPTPTLRVQCQSSPSHTCQCDEVLLVIRDRMLSKAANILKPIIWPPSMSHFKGRNPLPLLSRSLRSPQFRIASSFRQNKPALSRPCSFLHHPSIPVSSAMSSKKPLDHYRLPTDVRPRNYDLTIRTDLEKEKFSGFVRIK